MVNLIHMKQLGFVAVLVFGGLFFGSCEKEGSMPPINDSIDLDGKLINDSSLAFPELFLLSAKKITPSANDLQTPVYILVHGFSASTFEWSEFRDFAKNDGRFYTSQVLLGAHGRDYLDFRSANWHQWQQPILDEYQKLVSLGYQNIHFAASSTGCPLLLDALHHGKIVPQNKMNIVFIDPVVIPTTKTLSLIPVIGPALDYVETPMEKGEDGFWYKYRPYQALEQLNDVTKTVRGELEDGITLPKNVQLQVYKSIEDGTADPMSAVLLKKGVKLQDGSSVNVNMLLSELHVFTRLRARNKISNADVQNQLQVFNEMKSQILP